MAKEPNSKEKSLIDAFNAAIERNMKYDSREEGNYFESGTQKSFQKLALQAAALIEEQGAKNTAPVLVAIAKEIQGVGELGWNHANSIGFAVKKGLESQGSKAGKKGNPFGGMKL
ncbi:MAG TPA: hypothetical protein VEF76_05640 [Patescibacteria group bacterium]|nr:hypothetical protein [Patescibacteria group bacterium]